MRSVDEGAEHVEDDGVVPYALLGAKSLSDEMD